MEVNLDIHDFMRFQKSPSAYIWDIGNSALYQLCKDHPDHKRVDEIVAKVWLIGRSYAAAVERRQNKHESSDRFYVMVAERLINSEIDKHINSLPKALRLSEDNIVEIDKAHEYLSKIFKELTGKYKISLASKYLHFHRPIVPIYDSRANKSIKQVVSGKIRNHNEKRSDYLIFSSRFLLLQEFLLQETKHVYTPREIDKFLLERLESH